jgi:hypothetical protein
MVSCGNGGVKAGCRGGEVLTMLSVTFIWGKQFTVKVLLMHVTIDDNHKMLKGELQINRMISIISPLKLTCSILISP